MSPSLASLQAQEPTDNRLILWHPYTGQREARLNALVAEYNATSAAGTLIEAVSMGDRGRLYDQMILYLPDASRHDTLPNLFIAQPDDVALFALSARILELTEVMGDNPPPHIFQSLGQSAVDGSQLGWPVLVHSEMLVMNLDALDELDADLPTTLEAFGEQACQFKQANGWSGGKFGIVWGASIPTRAQFFYALLASLSAYPLQIGETVNLTFNLDTLTAPLRHLAELHMQGCVTSMDRPAALDDFVNGRALFYFASTAELQAIEDGIGSVFVEPFRWTVLPLQQTDTHQQWVYGDLMSIVNHEPASNSAAWEFVKWFTSAEQNAQWAEATLGFPVSVEAAEQIPISVGEQFPQWLVVLTEFLQSPSVVHQPLAGGSVLDFEVESTWQRILISHTDPTVELRALQERANQIIANFNY